MLAAILAGGLGTRMGGTTGDLPKPLLTVGGLPILVHVISVYIENGIREFVILGGHKYERLLSYFEGLPHHGREHVDLGIRLRHVAIRDWAPVEISILDTGESTPTGGRLLRARAWFGRRFCLTYGDSLLNFRLASSIALHESSAALATVCAYRFPFPYGTLQLEGSRVAAFEEKKPAPHISAGFFIVEPEALKYIPDEDCAFETTALPALARLGRLHASMSATFWHPMDTSADRKSLESIVEAAEGRPPWLD